MTIPNLSFASSTAQSLDGDVAGRFAFGDNTNRGIQFAPSDEQLLIKYGAGVGALFLLAVIYKIYKK